MSKHVRNIALLGVFMALLVGALGWMGPNSAEAAPQMQSSSSCVIPPSGPWPPCATGGTNTGGSSQSGQCTIPPSGPWPACAKNGGSTGGGSTGGSGGGNCVIPPSGPWPACAKGGTTSPTPTPTGKLCPPAGGQGKWVSCDSGKDPTTPSGPTQPKLCPPASGQGQWVLCNVAAGLPKVNSFWGTVTPNGDGSDRVELTWDTQSAHKVEIIVGINFGWSDVRRDVAASGTTTIVYDSDYLTRGNIGIRACNAQGFDCDSRLIPVTFSCEHDYFFSTANFKPAACSSDYYRERQAVYQQFEHGFAIWIERWTPTRQQAAPSVLFFTNNGFSAVFDTWKPGEPTSDPMLQVPAGKLQPTHGIGKAWRENAFVREQLGWAVSAEQPYTVESVAANSAPIFGSSTTYLSLPNENKIIEFSWGRRSSASSVGFVVKDI